MRLPPPPPVARAVARTPPDRDRLLDLIRAAALAVVVLGHGLMGVIGWAGTQGGGQGTPVVSNALATYGWASWATWLFQIMPLFFVAGGAVNARSWRSHRGAYAPWLWRRVARLLRPVWVYLLVMAPLAGVVSWLAPPGWSVPLLSLTTQLLWFVGVYVLVGALTPVLVALHARHWALGPALWLGLSALVDLARLGLGLPMVLGLLNFVLVWALAAQLGLLLDDGQLATARGLAAALGAMAVNLVLTTLGPYPTSMVGLPGEPFSNMAPPSLVLALHAVMLTGLVGWARPALTRLAAGPRVWTATTAVNLTAMTLYLWHLPVLIALVAVTHLLGLDRPVTWVDGQPVPAPGFWAWSVLFLAAFLAGVAGVVRIAGPAEHVPLRGWDRPARQSLGAAGPEARAAVVAALGCLAIGVGTLALSATGLAGFPTRVLHVSGVPVNAAVAIALMVLGGFLVRDVGSKAQLSSTSSNPILRK
ncbi:MAG TPA: acyltransferase [Candidatus Nanopelagicales bacterium]